jgi:hypothetical protein
MNPSTGVHSPLNPQNHIEITHTKFLELGISERHPDYEEQLSQWEYLADLYDGVFAWLKLTDVGFVPTEKTQKYLPRHIEEDYDSWVSRINSSHYDDLFAKAVNRFTDLIFRNGVTFSPDSEEFKRYFENLSDRGDAGQIFLHYLSLKAMVFGHVWVMVDYPVTNFFSYADFLASPISPYWVYYDPRNVINWKFLQNECVSATIRETVLVDDGLKRVEVEQYRVFFMGFWYFYRQTSDKRGWTVESGDMPSEFVPLVPVFGGVRLDEARSLPPLKSLADKNRALYQQQSDHSRKVSLCCQPVPVLKDQMRGDEPLRIGPNSFLQIRDPNGSFEWVEPLALSLTESREDLDGLKASIASDAANFLVSPTDRQSATATNLLTNPLEASLSGFVTRFLDGINSVAEVYCTYLGIDTVKIGLDPDVFPDATKDSQTSFALQNLYTTGIISKETALEALVALGFLPKTIDINEEIDRTNGTGTTEAATGTTTGSDREAGTTN